MSSELRPLSGAKLGKKALVTAVRDDTGPGRTKSFRGGHKHQHAFSSMLKCSDGPTAGDYGWLEGVGDDTQCPPA